MKNKKMITWSMFVVLLVFVSLYFDSEIVRLVFLIKNVFFDSVLLGLTFVSSELIILFFLTSLFLYKEHKRKWILALWLTLGLSGVVSFFLKIIVQRQRPFQLGLVSIFPVLEQASYFVWNFSFPSFQAMLGFCAVPILSKEFPKFKYWWIVFASLIAFSRVYFGLHFLSDVVAGGSIGYLLGVAVVKIETKTKFSERIYEEIFKKSKI